MREFKFKFWHKVEKKWIEPILIEMTGDKEATFIYLYGGLENNMGNIEVCQYTGFKDTKGNEIYEGDIVAYTAPRPSMYGDDIATINWRGNAWSVTQRQDVWDWSINAEFTSQHLEILGNIFQNPELL